MILCMKQKVFSIGDKFQVTDVNGEAVYTVQGEVFSIGKKFHIFDRMGTEVAFLAQKVFQFLPKFIIYKNGRIEAEIIKEFSIFTPRYRIIGQDWTIEGDLFHHNYCITQNGHCIVTICKRLFSWGDCYELDIDDDADEILALSVVLAIDAILASNDH